MDKIEDLASSFEEQTGLKTKDNKASPDVKRKRKNRAGMSVRNIDLDKLHKKLLNVLYRDTNHLLLSSHNKKLNRDDSASLTNYLKLIKELKKLDEDEVASLSDAQLENIARKRDE